MFAHSTAAHHADSQSFSYPTTNEGFSQSLATLQKEAEGVLEYTLQLKLLAIKDPEKELSFLSGKDSADLQFSLEMSDTEVKNFEELTEANPSQDFSEFKKYSILNKISDTNHAEYNALPTKFPYLHYIDTYLSERSLSTDVMPSNKYEVDLYREVKSKLYTSFTTTAGKVVAFTEAEREKINPNHGTNTITTSSNSRR
jgi:hypothetical protein